jgi:deazaflavin-dependent oxidoreductase (nitroreductase family)
MPLTGEYEPGRNESAEEQVRNYEATGGVEGGTFMGFKCVVLTTKGRQSGKLRKSPLVRVEHDGVYAVVASKRGADINPGWYHNLIAGPIATLQDGPRVVDVRPRQVDGDEKAMWWARAVEVWPEYDNYQAGTDRIIPVVVLEPIIGEQDE